MSQICRPSSPLGAQAFDKFGKQSTQYSDNAVDYGSVAPFTDIGRPLFDADDVSDRLVADDNFASAGAGHVTVIEPSDSWRFMVASTEGQRKRVEVIHGDGLTISLNGRFEAAALLADNDLVDLRTNRRQFQS